MEKNALVHLTDSEEEEVLVLPFTQLEVSQEVQKASLTKTSQRHVHL